MDQQKPPLFKGNGKEVVM